MHSLTLLSASNIRTQHWLVAVTSRVSICGDRRASQIGMDGWHHALVQRTEEIAAIAAPGAGKWLFKQDMCDVAGSSDTHTVVQFVSYDDDNNNSWISRLGYCAEGGFLSPVAVFELRS